MQPSSQSGAASSSGRAPSRTIFAGAQSSTHAWRPTAPRRPERLTNPARPSALVARVFDARVATAELRGEADASLLYPAEATYCARFAPKRRNDFTAGRLSARRALADLGIGHFPIPANADRSPRWPAGIVGSISHTDGYACAAVALESAIGSIGVDVEIVGRVTRNLDPLIFTRRESAFLATLAEAERARAATIIFSAKEAFYKCQYAVTRTWLDFQDATLELTTAEADGLVAPAPDELLGGTFTVEIADGLLAPHGGLRPPWRGKFCIARDLVVTGITLHHENDSAPSTPAMPGNAAAACSRRKR
jgi:4'-phosphopantetheinyl transferase EntD